MQEHVKEYYGKTIKSTKDLKTSACCLSESLPQTIKDILKDIDSEILDKFYGCGSPIPEDLLGCTMLDLGCGTGRDVYVASKLVGESGRVIGIDMTDEQLEVANRHVDSQMEKFGFFKPNVEFKKGFIEDLTSVGIKDDSIDVVTSNCVINLSDDKRAVFSEIFRVLKPGGELYFSDVFTGSRVPDDLTRDPVLVGECLGGALYYRDFIALMNEIGFADCRIVTKRQLTLDDPDVIAKAGAIDFYSISVRAFKLDTLEDHCEDYGQTAEYLGTISTDRDKFILDRTCILKKGVAVPVCGNTASMLEGTRLSEHFLIKGDKSSHFGPFDCSALPAETNTKNKSSCC